MNEHIPSVTGEHQLDIHPVSARRDRRSNDGCIAVWGGAPGGVLLPAASGHTYESAHARRAAFLLELQNGDALLVPAADAHVLSRARGAELHARAEALARDLGRERDRQARRLRMPDLLLAYADALLAARTEIEIYVALRDTAHALVSWAAALLFYASDEAYDAPFQLLTDPALIGPRVLLPARTATWFARPHTVTRTDVDTEPRGVLAPFAPLMDSVGAVLLLCAPVAGDALLLLVERRRGCTPTSEERDLLSALLNQAEGALQRLALERRCAAAAVHEHSEIKTSPAEAVVDCALAIAQNGHSARLVAAAGSEAPLAACQASLGAIMLALREKLEPAPLSGGSLVLLLSGVSPKERTATVEQLRAQLGGFLHVSGDIAVFAPALRELERTESPVNLPPSI